MFRVPLAFGERHPFFVQLEILSWFVSHLLPAKTCHFDRRDGAFCRPGAGKSLFDFKFYVYRPDSGRVLALSFPLERNQAIPSSALRNPTKYFHTR